MNDEAPLKRVFAFDVIQNENEAVLCGDLVMDMKICKGEQGDYHIIL